MMDYTLKLNQVAIIINESLLNKIKVAVANVET